MLSRECSGFQKLSVEKRRHLVISLTKIEIKIKRLLPKFRTSSLSKRRSRPHCRPQ